MAQDFSKVKLGACKVTWDVDGTQSVIETTIGGVVFNLRQTSIEVKTDQTGDTVVKKIKNAVECTVEVPIGEYDLPTLQKMIPDSTLITNGTDPNKKKITINGTSGADLLTFAKKVKIEPLNGTAADTITLLKACPEPDIQVNYRHDDTRAYKVVFVAYPDTENNNEMVWIGDPTA